MQWDNKADCLWALLVSTAPDFMLALKCSLFSQQDESVPVFFSSQRLEEALFLQASNNALWWRVLPICMDPWEGENLHVPKGKIIKGRVLVTTSPECGSSPRKKRKRKKKLLRCPEKPLSHRAHQECGRWGTDQLQENQHHRDMWL